MAEERDLDVSPESWDETKTTTCYMCACRCGVRVRLKDGKIRYIEGNPDHPVNKGVLCAKGSAGIMQQYSPAKLRAPLKRVGPRGEGEFEEISWEEALELAVSWLKPVRETDPKKLAFFTGRDQSQALTGFWASQFGTPNYAAHGGFCSVNMAAAGLYTFSGSFWEFGEPDFERARYLLMFGVAEDHDSNPIKLGIAEMKKNGAKICSVNPVRTGYSAVADEWVSITPGTDGLFVMALIHELLRAGKVDLDYLARWTNAGWLVIEDTLGPEDGLFARDDDGEPLCLDRKTGAIRRATDPEAAPALKGAAQLEGNIKARPAFELLAKRYLAPEYAPKAVAERCGVPAERIQRIAAELARAAFEESWEEPQPWVDVHGRRHETVTARPVSMMAMRGISAHANGFHTCRSIHILQILLGAIDRPGALRYKAPFPRSIPPAPKPAGKPEQIQAGRPMGGPPLGFPHGPEDLIVDENGAPMRIDKAFSWEAPLAVHGMMHAVIANAARKDPYGVDVLFMYMANMAWNSAMNTAETIEMLTKKDEATGDYVIPKIIYADSYSAETVAYADLILPDTTYLERWDCISLLDRPIGKADAVGDSIRQPVIEPDRDVRPFQTVLIDLGARLGLPAFVNEDGSPKYPGGYADYIVNHQRTPGVGPLAGFRGEHGDQVGVGAPNPEQLDRYVDNGCFFQHEFAPEERFMKNANGGYLETAKTLALRPDAKPVYLQLYSEILQKFRLAAQGHGAKRPPASERERVERHFDPLPFWSPPEDGVDRKAFPIRAITQRPMAMYHSWGSQNAWLRQIHGANKLYVPRALADQLGVKSGDWVAVESRNGRIEVEATIQEGLNPKTVWTWNAIGKRRGAWGLAANADEAVRGFLLNHLIEDLLPAGEDGRARANADPVTGQAAWYDLRVRIEKIAAPRATSAPTFAILKAPPGAPAPIKELRYGDAFTKEGAQ